MSCMNFCCTLTQKGETESLPFHHHEIWKSFCNLLPRQNDFIQMSLFCCATVELNLPVPLYHVQQGTLEQVG